MKVLLTGATGFIGKKLTSFLLANGCEIIIIARKNSKLLEIEKLTKDLDVEFIENNDLEAIFRRNRNINLIIHAATDYGIDDSAFLNTFRTNVELPLNLLGLAVKYKIPKFINLDTFYNCKNTNYEYLQSYVLSKRQFQEWGLRISNIKKINFINLRLYHVYGEGDGHHKFVPDIIKKCQSGENIDLTVGTQRRDFIHVDDVVEAIAIVAKTSLIHGYHHFDVGSGDSISIRKFVELVNRFCGNKAKLNFGALSARAGEWDNISADPSSLHKLGWNIQVSIENGLKKLCNAS